MSDPVTVLAEFVTYVETHLSGDEKGDAADFLDHLFRALGHGGAKEAGATRETRVPKKAGGKGKNYIDLLTPACAWVGLNFCAAGRERAAAG